MHNKDKAISDKKLPYEYNICLYILEELCDKGVIDVFEMTEALILLRKKYKMPVISIYGKKGNNSIDYKAVTRERRSGVTRPQIVAQWFLERLNKKCSLIKKRLIIIL